MSRYMSSLPGTTIIEENLDDNYWCNDEKSNYDNSIGGKSNTSLSLPISQSQSFDQRKGSPAPRVGSMEGSNYMDKCSPCGSSPGDQNPNYLPMSPGMMEYSRGYVFLTEFVIMFELECSIIKYFLNYRIYTSSSGAHSRASSLAEEPNTGYMQMCPQQSEDYVDMDQSRHHHIHHHPTNSMSSAASSCSITSGTPSTDIRFVDYHLDKVSARFTPDDEDTSSITERPTRAYSVGSKLEHNKRKFRSDLINQDTINSRERAFSVGSRVKHLRSELYRGVLTPSAQENVNPNKILTEIKGKKSTSAPLLSSKFHTSIDPMDDLMEIDYSNRDEKSCTTTPMGSEGSITGSAYRKVEPEKMFNDLMEIDYSIKRNRTSSTPVKTSLPVPVPNNRRYEKTNASPKVNSNYSEYVDMHPIPQNIIEDEGYMNMQPIGIISSISNSPSLSSSPVKSIVSPKTSSITASPYSSSYDRKMNSFIDSPSNSLNKIMSHPITSPKTLLNEYMSMRPSDNKSSIKNTELPKTVSAPEGYMEMSWGKESRNLNNNTIPEKRTPEELINKNFSSETRLTSSLPITIQNRNKNHNIHNESTIIPKNPSGSMYFPLATNTASPKTAKLSESKDSGIVTPSDSTAAIFPFSPNSPDKNIVPLDINIAQRGCYINNSAVSRATLSEEDEFDLDDDSSSKLSKSHSSESTPIQLDDLSNNYADMTLGGPSLLSRKPISLSLTTTPLPLTEYPDYVNCAPMTVETKPIIPSPSSKVSSSESDGDYAFVDPTKTPQPSFRNDANVVQLKKSVLVTVNNNRDKLPIGSFKPIPSQTDELLVRNNNYFNKSGSPKPSVTSGLNRQLSEKRASEEMNEICGGYEILQVRNENKKFVLSRPNSVNSEKISTSSSISSAPNRPNSANSERLPFISTSSSSSTLCGSSSTSSSTLCGSKSQSPSNTRPQSFGEIGAASRSDTSCIDPSSLVSSRPPSVTSERELHYASLDLPPASTISSSLHMDTDECKYPLTPNSGNESSSASPSPNTAGSVPVRQTYARIDFAKCEHKKSTKSN